MKKLLTIFNIFSITILTSITSVSCLENKKRSTTNSENSTTGKQKIDATSAVEPTAVIEDMEQADLGSESFVDQVLTTEGSQSDSLNSKSTSGKNVPSSIKELAAGLETIADLNGNSRNPTGSESSHSDNTRGSKRSEESSANPTKQPTSQPQQLKPKPAKPTSPPRRSKGRI